MRISVSSTLLSFASIASTIAANPSFFESTTSTDEKNHDFSSSSLSKRAEELRAGNDPLFKEKLEEGGYKRVQMFVNIKLCGFPGSTVALSLTSDESKFLMATLYDSYWFTHGNFAGSDFYLADIQFQTEEPKSVSSDRKTNLRLGPESEPVLVTSFSAGWACHFCDPDLVPEHSVAPQTKKGLHKSWEHSLCDKLRDSPFNVFSSLSDCDIQTGNVQAPLMTATGTAAALPSVSVISDGPKQNQKYNDNDNDKDIPQVEMAIVTSMKIDNLAIMTSEERDFLGESIYKAYEAAYTKKGRPAFALSSIEYKGEDHRHTHDWLGGGITGTEELDWYGDDGLWEFFVQGRWSVNFGCMFCSPDNDYPPWSLQTRNDQEEDSLGRRRKKKVVSSHQVWEQTLCSLLSNNVFWPIFHEVSDCKIKVESAFPYTDLAEVW